MRDPILYSSTNRALEYVMIFYVFSISLSPSNWVFSQLCLFFPFGSLCINHDGWDFLVDLICTKKSRAKYGGNIWTVFHITAHVSLFVTL